MHNFSWKINVEEAVGRTGKNISVKTWVNRQSKKLSFDRKQQKPVAKQASCCTKTAYGSHMAWLWSKVINSWIQQTMVKNKRGRVVKGEKCIPAGLQNLKHGACAQQQFTVCFQIARREDFECFQRTHTRNKTLSVLVILISLLQIVCLGQNNTQCSAFVQVLCVKCKTVTTKTMEAIIQKIKGKNPIWT